MFNSPCSRRFYLLHGKRLFDIVLSIIGLVLLSPALLVVALFVRFTSEGPVFYSQQRVGRGGILFRIVKFRSMEHRGERVGPSITYGNGSRVTPIGRLLRRTKIDELPQLWNVLRGEMSLVGPRPEVPAFVAGYGAKQREVLAVRPGMTDLASIRYWREEDLLGRASDPERYYRELILPDKLQLGLAYINECSVLVDLRLLSTTIGVLCGVGKRSQGMRA